MSRVCLFKVVYTVTQHWRETVIEMVEEEWHHEEEEGEEEGEEKEKKEEVTLRGENLTTPTAKGGETKKIS